MSHSWTYETLNSKSDLKFMLPTALLQGPLGDLKMTPNSDHAHTGLRKYYTYYYREQTNPDNPKPGSTASRIHLEGHTWFLQCQL